MEFSQLEVVVFFSPSETTLNPPPGHFYHDLYLGDFKKTLFQNSSHSLLYLCALCTCMYSLLFGVVKGREKGRVSVGIRFGRGRFSVVCQVASCFTVRS